MMRKRLRALLVILSAVLAAGAALMWIRGRNSFDRVTLHFDRHHIAGRVYTTTQTPAEFDRSLSIHHFGGGWWICYMPHDPWIRQSFYDELTPWRQDPSLIGVKREVTEMAGTLGCHAGNRWGEEWWLAAPDWGVVAVLLILPLLWLRAVLRRCKRRRLRLCPACGYDLRATPDQCPECGLVETTGAA